MNNTPQMQNTVTTETISRKELIEQAIRATDAYLGIEKESRKRGYSTKQDVQEFIHYVRMAQDALHQLGAEIADKHSDYMKQHIQVMIDMSGPENEEHLHNSVPQIQPTTSGQVEEAIHIHKQTKDILDVIASRHNVEPKRLHDVYERGMKAKIRGEYPKHTQHQAGMHRVDQYLDSENAEQNRKELHRQVAEEKERGDDSLDVDDFENDVESLKWYDIIDLYDENELVVDKERHDKEENQQKKIDEGLSATERIRRRATFSRFSSKREAAKRIKLRRASDMTVLKKRAKLAARRLLMKRLLRGRSKSDLSAEEKSRIEKVLSRMGTLQTTLANKLVPKIREIEKDRLASQRTKKS